MKRFSLLIALLGIFVAGCSTNEPTPEPVKPSNDVPHNEIWYTSTDGNIVEPSLGASYDDEASEMKSFGANIVSNTYEDGKGVITFDGDVKYITSGAFYNCETLNTITVPECITEISAAAFNNCSNITSFDIPDSVTELGTQAFSGCNALESVTIGKGVKSIGNTAFFMCASLTSITIPENVTSFGTHPFGKCVNLEEFRGPYAVDNGKLLICNNTLAGFAPKGMTECIIPDGVTTINAGALAYCTELTYISIPESVTTIGSDAFYGCKGLTELYFPANVNSIGSYAFAMSSNLQKVYFESVTPPTAVPNRWDSWNAFDYTTAKICVPAESVDAYKSAEHWSNYADRIKSF